MIYKAPTAIKNQGALGVGGWRGLNRDAHERVILVLITLLKRV